ncbi:MAG: hypothetical protein EKK42_20435 [Pseudonocardiaceae bacterium]|nr:MAG: hypothetical protein EKK42_20435 [Pseudonocardiaceae bacterium]
MSDEQRVTFPTLWVALAWIERHCVIPDGMFSGDPFMLLDWQRWSLANHYRVKDTATFNPDSPVLGPAFHNRRSMVVLPQKSGKGPLSAAVACLEGVGPSLFYGWAEAGDKYRCRDWGCPCGWVYSYRAGEPMGMLWSTPLIQLTASSVEQVENVFAALRPMINQGPLSELVPHTREEFIRLPGNGRIDAVSSSARSRLGQRVTCRIGDELGLWLPNTQMIRVDDTQRRGLAGMGGRAFDTTNAWDPGEYSSAQQTAEAGLPDVFVQHPQPPANLSYLNKQERRKIHQLVYGSSLKSQGGHVDLDSIEAEAAELLKRDPNQAARFFGNLIVAGNKAWIPAETWKSAETSQRIPTDGKLVLGFDGSDSDDWTAIRASTLSGFGFTPTYGPDMRPTTWNPAEWGGRIPRSEVHAAVDELCRRYNVVRMYCDPRDWQTEIESWALAYGTNRIMEWSTNRIAAMHETLVRFETDVSTGVATHAPDFVLDLHIGNAVRHARPGDRYILGKASEHQKIDVAMATVLAHEARCDAVASGIRDVAPSRRKVVVLR